MTTVLTRLDRIRLNRYGNLLFLTSGLVGLLAVQIAGRQPAGPQALVTLLSILALGVAAWGIRVTARLPLKVRIAETTLRRVRRSGYRPEHFSGMFCDLCTRLVTRVVLEKLGLAHEYTALRRRFGHEPFLIVEHSSPEVLRLLGAGKLTHADISQAVATQLAMRVDAKPCLPDEPGG